MSESQEAWRGPDEWPEGAEGGGSEAVVVALKRRAPGDTGVRYATGYAWVETWWDEMSGNPFDDEGWEVIGWLPIPLHPSDMEESAGA